MVRVRISFKVITMEIAIGHSSLDGASSISKYVNIRLNQIFHILLFP